MPGFVQLPQAGAPVPTPTTVPSPAPAAGGATPPANPAEHAQRTQGWLNFLQHPEVTAMLMQLGMGLMQPRSITQSAGGQVANAVAEAGNAGGRVQAARAAQEQQALANQLETRKVAATEQQAGAAVTQAGAAQTNAQTNAAALPSETALRKAQADQAAEATRLMADEVQARVTSAKASMKSARAAVMNADTEASRTAAQNNLNEMQGKYYEALGEQARAGGPAGQVTDKLATAISTVTGVSKEQALIQANAATTLRKQMSRQDFEAQMYINLTKDSAEEDRSAPEYTQAIKAFVKDMADYLYGVQAVPAVPAGVPGSPSPAKAGAAAAAGGQPRKGTASPSLEDLLNLYPPQGGK